MRHIMYPPQKDSPSTFTTGPLGSKDTTIYVASAFVLSQETPFPLTLGIDKDVTETVMVTNVDVSNNILRVERSDGSLAWPAQTTVARVFTANDLTAVQDNLAYVEEETAKNKTDITNLYASDELLSGRMDTVESNVNSEIAATNAKINKVESDLDTYTAELDTTKVNKADLKDVVQKFNPSTATATDVFLNLSSYNAVTNAVTTQSTALPVADSVKKTAGVISGETLSNLVKTTTDVANLELTKADKSVLTEVSSAVGVTQATDKLELTQKLYNANANTTTVYNVPLPAASKTLYGVMSPALVNDISNNKAAITAVASQVVDFFSSGFVKAVSNFTYDKTSATLPVTMGTSAVSYFKLTQASSTKAGIMSAETYDKIVDHEASIKALQQQGGRYIGVSFATKAELDRYVIPTSVNDGDFAYVEDDETRSGATTRYFYKAESEAFTFGYVIESDPTPMSTNLVAGIVKTGDDLSGGVILNESGKMYAKNLAEIATLTTHGFIENFLASTRSSTSYILNYRRRKLNEEAINATFTIGTVSSTLAGILTADDYNSFINAVRGVGDCITALASKLDTTKANVALAKGAAIEFGTNVTYLVLQGYNIATGWTGQLGTKISLPNVTRMSATPTSVGCMSYNTYQALNNKASQGATALSQVNSLTSTLGNAPGTIMPLASPTMAGLCSAQHTAAHDDYISKRSHFRGADLGAFKTAHYNKIVAGDYSDFFLGDYWTIGDRIYRIADFDYFRYIYDGTSANWTHAKRHIVVVPDYPLVIDAPWGAAGPSPVLDYTHSTIRTSSGGGLAQARNIIYSDFGSSSRILPLQLYLTTSDVRNKKKGAWTTNCKVELLSEEFLFGRVRRTTLYATTKEPTLEPLFPNYDQFALFKLGGNYYCRTNRECWIQDGYDERYKSVIGISGNLFGRMFDDLKAVRPFFCIGG